MEELAASTIPSGSSAQIQQVYDQYLNFTCSEPNMFSLNDRQSYLALHDPTAPETAIETSIDKAASSLFSVLATMGKPHLEGFASMGRVLVTLRR